MPQAPVTGFETPSTESWLITEPWLNAAMKIFFSAGEPSGDVHGANLIRALSKHDPEFEAVGYGGPKMAAAGCDLHCDLTEFAVMWIFRVLINLHKFLELASRADRYFRHHRPDAVVVIDYPGFNWWIARRAKVHGIPVFYFAPPQVWAWATHRVRKMRRDVDHVLCAMPFEQQWYAERGCNATLVGHPFFDEVAGQQLNATFLTQQRAHEGPLVAILPGSRTQEVENNLETLVNAAELVHRDVPSARFAVASFKESQAAMAREALAGRNLPIEVFTDRTPELIELATCCMSVSGSVSLELLYRLKPTVISYRIGPFFDWLQRRFRHIKYITLVNLLATDDIFSKHVTPYDPAAPEHAGVLFPEYVSSGDMSPQIARHVIEWLTDETARETLRTRLADLQQREGQPGATERAAEYIVAQLSSAATEPQHPSLSMTSAAAKSAAA